MKRARSSYQASYFLRTVVDYKEYKFAMTPDDFFYINLEDRFKILGFDISYSTSYTSGIGVYVSDTLPYMHKDKSLDKNCTTLFSSSNSLIKTFFCADGGVIGQYVLLTNLDNVTTAEVHISRIEVFGNFIETGGKKINNLKT